MNIGIVTTWFDRGAAYVSRAYWTALRTNNRVFIYARGGERYARGNPYWDLSIVTWGKEVQHESTGIDWTDFRDWVFSRELDLIIFNEQQSWEVIVKSLKLDVTIGAYIDYYTPQTVPYFWLYDFLLCNTRHHYSVFKSHPQAFFIPWGTDISSFTPIRATLSKGVTFFHSAGMGGLRGRKGTDLAVRAFQNVRGEAKLLIHSQVSLGRFADVADLIGVDPRIEFLQETVPPPGLYHRGDVYVYPSRLEGIGLTIAEALACGLPVITTDAAPMNEFVRDGQNGMLVRVARSAMRPDNYYWPESICSINDLTRAMQYFVDRHDELADWKIRARAYAEAHLDWNKNDTDLQGLVESVRRVEKKRSLIAKVVRYERSTRKHGPQTMRRLLSRLGAGKVKRYLARPLSRL
jgi:1,2-diacylglycerol 3-alpha-glucosyltransferase